MFIVVFVIWLFLLSLRLSFSVSIYHSLLFPFAVHSKSAYIFSSATINNSIRNMINDANTHKHKCNATRMANTERISRVHLVEMFWPQTMFGSWPTLTGMRRHMIYTCVNTKYLSFFLFFLVNMCGVCCDCLSVQWSSFQSASPCIYTQQSIETPNHCHSISVIFYFLLHHFQLVFVCVAGISNSQPTSKLQSRKAKNPSQYGHLYRVAFSRHSALVIAISISLTIYLIRYIAWAVCVCVFVCVSSQNRLNIHIILDLKSVL